MRQRLFEDFIDDIDVEQDVPQRDIEVQNDRTDLAKLDIEIWVMRRACETRQSLGQALRTFIRKIIIIAHHSKFIDSIENIKFENYKTLNAGREHIVDVDGIQIISHGDIHTEQSTEFQNLYCYIYFFPRRNWNGRHIAAFYNDVCHMMRITGTVDLPSNRQYCVESGGLSADVFFTYGSAEKEYAEEIFSIAQVFNPNYSYADYLRDFNTDGFGFMMFNHFFYGQFGDQIDEMWKHVKKVGHFDKTGDSALLPDYIKERHPVAGCTDVFLPFGTYDFATSSPWSPTLRWTEMRDHCNTHGCTVYLLKDAENNDNAVFCVYDGMLEFKDNDSKMKTVQIVTETTGKEMGYISKEMALSCFVDAEMAEELCAEFFGSEDEEDEEPW